MPGIPGKDFHGILESILSADLNRAEHIALAEELHPAIDDLIAYGIDRLEVVSVALQRGHAHGGKDAGPPDPILVDARLNILERGGHVDEFLDLCRETGSI
jgi:hypothetical protein